MYYLLYRSQATEALNAAQLTCLLEQAREFNLRHNLTGLLLYTTDHQFLQVFEGDKQAVRTAYYESIVHDSRHHDCFVLSEGLWRHGSFPDWSMAFLTPEHEVLPRKPGLLAISQLHRVLSVVARAHPGLSQLLLNFVERYEPIS
ncbi:hypothetical protein GCM10022409_19630 [Hymenobacter glaciei]|uniref:BLUF domain-containing protein n=1 Tax=Hymenobacter glaciei TaxID=877209 RepID=A0ABP7U347_9BACT